MFIFIVLALTIMMVSGCAASQRTATPAYAYPPVASAATYLCSRCGHQISGNNCDRCGGKEGFFYTPPVSPQEPENYQYGNNGGNRRRNHGPSDSGWSHTRHRSFDKGGYQSGETPNGYWETYWDFRDYDTRTDYSHPHWTTRSYRPFR